MRKRNLEVEVWLLRLLKCEVSLTYAFQYRVPPRVSLHSKNGEEVLWLRQLLLLVKVSLTE
jgi:hypothetical protein